MFKTVLWVALVVVVVVTASKLVFDIDAIELTKGFLSWLFDLLWRNQV